MSIANIVGLIGGLLGVVAVVSTAWAVARKGLKDQTIATQATHITALSARVGDLERSDADCKKQLAALQTTLDTLVARMERSPSIAPRPRTQKRA